VRAKVEAYNVIDISLISSESTNPVIAATYPTIASGWSLSATPTVSSAFLSWASIVNQVDTGYSPITSYKIYQKIPPSTSFSELMTVTSNS